MLNGITHMCYTAPTCRKVPYTDPAAVATSNSLRYKIVGKSENNERAGKIPFSNLAISNHLPCSLQNCQHLFTTGQIIYKTKHFPSFLWRSCETNFNHGVWTSNVTSQPWRHNAWHTRGGFIIMIIKKNSSSK